VTGTLIEGFRRRAAFEGDASAYTIVVDGEREEVSLSFAELDHRARGIAGRLQSLGKKGDPVLLLCPDSLEYIVGALGCLYAGMVLVPGQALGLQIEADRLTRLAEGSGARVGVTTRESLPRVLAIPELSRLRWVMADEANEGARESWAEPGIDADDLALVIFTSGSTAEPKGVVLSHRSVLHAGERMTGPPGERGGDRRVLITPPHFAAGMVGILYSLVAGIPVTHVPPDVVSARPARWLENVSRIGATMSGAPNYLYDLSIQAFPAAARDELDLSAVRLLWNAGESVRADTIARFEAHFAPCGLRPGVVRPAYGMSEGVGTTAKPGAPLTLLTVDRVQLQHGEVAYISARAEGGRQLMGLGGPPPDLSLEIVDPMTRTRGEPGRVGEIWASGPSIARGYWDRPAETRAAFAAYLADTGEGPFFRTGDLGFVDQGELFITGRLKELIIIRGRNLYPVDIEASLQGCHPALRGQAAAAFALDDGGEERLAIVHEVRGSEEIPAIISAIRQVVTTHHGVQAHAVALVPPGAIPRAGHGKIGRNECRERLIAGSLPILAKDVLDPLTTRQSTPYVAPRTDTERALAGVWQRVLKLPRVGIHDNFADLGGDSLLSMQVLLAAEDVGLDLRVADLRRHGTIAELAEAIDTRREEKRATRGPREGRASLLPRQLYLLRQGEAASSWAVETYALQADVPLDAAILERCLQHLHFHHDALRLRCTRTGRGWSAEYSSHTPTDLALSRDLSAEPEPRLAERVTEEVAELCRSLDVTEGPLLRALHLRLGPAKELLVLAAHHLVTDAYSVAILVGDLDTLYRQLAASETPRLSPPTATLEEWQQQAIAFAHSDRASAEVAYWIEIATHAPTSLPLDFSGTPRRSGREEVVQVRVDADATGRLRSLHRQGLGLPDVIHYALARALREEAGSETAHFWTISHGRGSVLPAVDLSRTVGFLVRGYPVRFEPPESEDELEAARDVKRQLEQIPHRGMGFEILQNYSPHRVVRQQLARWEPPVRLNYVGYLDHLEARLHVFRLAEGWGEALDQSRLRSERVPWSPRVEVAIRPRGERLDLRLTYHSSAYLRSHVERFAGRIVDALGRLAAAQL
jgi:non-ribosomal peptide synthase protein (TIGR01720 family)